MRDLKDNYYYSSMKATLSRDVFRTDFLKCWRQLTDGCFILRRNFSNDFEWMAKLRGYLIIGCLRAINNENESGPEISVSGSWRSKMRKIIPKQIILSRNGSLWGLRYVLVVTWHKMATDTAQCNNKLVSTNTFICINISALKKKQKGCSTTSNTGRSEIAKVTK